MFTPEYIKMCQEAKEIQEQYEKYEEEGDRIFMSDGEHVISEFVPPRNEFIWLPLQHQLQEMIQEEHLYYKLTAVHRFLVKETIGLHLKTFEELWLCFVMYKLYQKKWSGTEWIKESE